MNKPSWLKSETWTKFIAKYGNSPQCKWEGCNKLADTVDHIVARRNGGSDEIENLQPLCREHNSKKGIKPDEYWSKQFFFDHPIDHPRINLEKLRTAQRREGWDRVIDYKDWFLRPWNQINRIIYGNFWIVGAGKTLAPVVQACALNYLIQRDLGKSHPRINRILILTKELAIRDQIANSFSGEGEGANDLVKYGISSDAPRVGILSEGSQLIDFPSLERCDIWVACIQQFFETNNNPRKNLSEILAQFPFIAIDEPHHALNQVLNIVQKAVDSLVFGYTGTPIEADGQALSQFTSLSVYDYDDANENDRSMKYVSDKDGEYKYFIEEVGITKAELINDDGFLETDDATQEGYDKNLRPQLSVVQAVLTYMESCDKIEQKTSLISEIAPHRPEGSKAELWYPVHSMIVVDSVQIGRKICEKINQIFESNRRKFPKDKGYSAEIIHSNLAEALEDKNLKRDEKNYIKGKKMSPKHPWMLYQQMGIIDENCSRVLVVIGMAREGVSNRYCGCIGYACKSESLIELVQRAIGRQIRSYDQKEQLKKQFKPGETDLDLECITLFTPPKRLDSVKIITHETYGNVNDIRRAISYICNMRDHLEAIPTIEQLIEGEITPGVDIPIQGILKTKEKIEIAGDIGKTKQTNPNQPINTGKYQDNWGDNNSDKRQKISEWVGKVVDNPEDAEREINYTETLPEIPVVWDEKLDSQPSREQLTQYIKTHEPDLSNQLDNPSSQIVLERLYIRWIENFDLGHIPNISKLSDIRKSIASKVISSLGKNLDNRNKVYELVGSAMKQVLGTNKPLKDDSRYNCPQAQAILTRKDVTQKIIGWVRHQLIIKGYCPNLAVAFEIETEEN